ncbi:MAG: hypoxanthine phosphoribosyltransferase [Candidatus Poriferisodalaceae bacterium]|jgi:hypoxanthine phosphoribosyltransferase
MAKRLEIRPLCSTASPAAATRLLGTYVAADERKRRRYGRDWVVTERETLDWATYGTAARQLAQTVADDGYQPDMILAIARGGLFMAGSLGYALSVKNLYVMNVEYYTGVDERLDVPVMLPPYLDFVEVTDAKVLIADDVADTGHTLAMVREFCLGKVAEVRTAVLYEKSHSVVNCEYVWKHTDQWINFPWSTEPPVIAPGTGQTTSYDA